MANTLKLAATTTSGHTPDGLQLGELAVNTTNKKVWVGTNGNTSGNVLLYDQATAYTNTTYSEGDHGLTQANFTDTLRNKLNAIAASANNYSLPLAASGTRGGVKIGYTESGKNYPVELSSEKMYVNVPWSNTTYSEGDHGLTQANFTDTLRNKLNGIATSANNYSHPSYNGDDFSVDTGALTGATVVSDIDINVTTDGSGHVTDANGSVATRTLTLANLGYTGATNANYFTCTLSSLGGITAAYAEGLISDVVDSAPSALNTLNELAAALGDDSNYAATITTALAGKYSTSNPAGYTTNTGTTTASNSQTFTNKGGNISQWTNNSGYTTNTGTTTASNSQTFTNKGGNISQWTNNSGYTTNTGTTTASNSQTFTNKGGNISQWTNNSGYITGVTNISGSSGSCTGNAATATTASNSNLLDNIDSGSFLRSDTADTSNYRSTFSACANSNYDTIATASGSQGGIEIYNNGAGNDAFMAFHAGGDFAMYFGLDADNNKLSVGGWSMGAAKYEIYHSGNKPSLSTLGFSGASNANYITNNNQLTNGNGFTTNTGTTTASNSQTFTNKGGNISQWTNNSGYTTNTGTTTASNSQTFTNKSGNISQWSNDSGYITDGNSGWNNTYGYTTNTGTTTPSNSQTFTNKSGNISMWTNNSGYTTNTGTTTASNSQTFTNKGGNISQWTNDSGYITDGNTGWNNTYGYTTNTGTTTPSNSQTFTNKSGNISQWSNDSGYTTNTGTTTASNSQTFTNKGGNISQWTNNSGYTTNTGTTTASNSQTFTNKSGNISQWTNNSGYVTSNTTYSAGSGMYLNGTTFSCTVTGNQTHSGDVSGSTTLTIGAGKVEESMLHMADGGNDANGNWMIKRPSLAGGMRWETIGGLEESHMNISNAGTNGQVLTRRSGNSGGWTWEDASGGGSVSWNDLGNISALASLP